MKGPLRKAVLTQYFFYNSAEEIHAYLCKIFQDDDTKHYHLIQEEKLSEICSSKQPLAIINCQKRHMIAFQPDGSLQTKDNLCSCKNCIIGDFVNCPFKSGSKNSFGDVDSEAGYND